MKHGDTCLCERCLRELMKAHDAYMKAWLRRIATGQLPGSEEGK